MQTINILYTFIFHFLCAATKSIIFGPTGNYPCLTRSPNPPRMPVGPGKPGSPMLPFGPYKRNKSKTDHFPHVSYTIEQKAPIKYISSKTAAMHTWQLNMCTIYCL